MTPHPPIHALSLAVAWALLTSASAASTYDVRAFGAKGDGQANDAPAINGAIEAASAAGGGTVGRKVRDRLLWALVTGESFPGNE